MIKGYKKLAIVMTAVIASFCLQSTIALAGNTKSHCKIPKATISPKEVRAAQTEWANGLLAIGKAYRSKKNFKMVAKQVIDKLYAYNFGKGVVLFKPTKAAVHPFRKTAKGALSYFVNNNTMYKEDKGFALSPFTKIRFQNNAMYFHHNIAVAMGEYFFTLKSGKSIKVEYTLGYVKTCKGQLKIFLQHSSLPFSQ